MHFEVFVDPEGVECGCVKSGEEHVDDYQQVDFPFLYPVGEVFVVVCKSAVGVKVCLEGVVVVFDCEF